MRVKDIKLSVVLKYVAKDDTLHQARMAFARDKVNVRLVASGEGNEILGLMTTKDLLQVPIEDFHRYTVADVYSQNLLTVSPETSIRAASALMLRYSCHHLLVEEQGQAVGLLSSLDLVNVYHDAYSSEPADTFMEFVF